MPKTLSPVRRFFVPTLVQEDGRAVISVQGTPTYVVDVSKGTATLSAGKDGSARTVVDLDSADTAERLLDGSLHPVVAALQRHMRQEGDRSFGIQVLLALRASAFGTEGRSDERHS